MGQGGDGQGGKGGKGGHGGVSTSDPNTGKIADGVDDKDNKLEIIVSVLVVALLIIIAIFMVILCREKYVNCYGKIRN